MCLVGTLTIGQMILLSSSSFFAIVRRFSQGLRVSWVTPGLNWRGSLWETMDFLQWTLNLQVRRNKFIKNWTQITTIAHNDNYFGEVLGCLYPCLTVIWNKGTRLVNTKNQKCRSWPWGHDKKGGVLQSRCSGRSAIFCSIGVNTFDMPFQKFLARKRLLA